jgi:dTDP-glucose 4,6-dehydratase
MTILTFAQQILALTGSKNKIVFKPLPMDDPKVRRPDISLAQKLLDWKPKVSLEEGLKTTFTYFQEHIDRVPKKQAHSER